MVARMGVMKTPAMLDAEAATTAAETLPPAPAAGSAGGVGRAPAPTPVPVLNPAANQASATQAARVPQSNDGRIDTVPVQQTRIYIQAGAFSDHNNAMRLSGELRRIAPSQISETRVDGQTFYRVRLGPYASASQLESAKQQLAGNGIEAVAIRDRAR